jgi:PAS domain S-box-containing protein
MSRDDKKRRYDDELQSKTELLHELQVHQIELEMQNRQLMDAQQQLEETRDRYADLYDYAPVGYLTLDEQGVVLEINLTGAGMLGMERLSIVGKPFSSCLSATSIHSFLTHLKNIFSLPGNSITEVLIKVKEGKPRLMSLESAAVPGEKRTCRTMMHDITMQRRMAVALQVNCSAQDALLKAIPALVFYLDANLRFLNVSQAFSDFVGRSSKDISGKSFYDLLPAGIAEDFQQIATSVLQTGMALYGFENSLRDSDGSTIYFSTVFAPYRDLEEKVIGLVGASIDITSIRSAANLNSDLLMENRHLTRNLFTAQEEERRHLARELHDELGQWFTAIQAEAQILCNVAKHSPEIHGSAHSISQSTGKVHEVIRGMLRHLRPSLLDELGLADSLRELKRQWCTTHPDIECTLKLEAALEGLGEELNVTLYRLVQESLNNIASHAGAHKVMVSVLQTGGDSDSKHLLLIIEDDGTGFDSKKANAGIGLLGMRERVIAVGGDFYIDSAPGSGTKLSAKLPMGK